MILQKMKKTAEDYLGQEITEALLSLPIFSNLYIKLTPPSLRATSPIFLRSKNTEEEGESNPLFIAEKCTYIALRQPVRLRDTAGRSVRVPLYYYTDSHLPVSSGVKPLWWA